MAIYSQLSIANKRINGYLQSTVNSQKTLKWLSTIRVVINRLKIWKLYKYKASNTRCILFFFFLFVKGCSSRKCKCVMYTFIALD